MKSKGIYDMDVNTIIKIDTNVSNVKNKPQWESAYYRLKNGPFTVIFGRDSEEMKFEGKFFQCLGHTFFGGFKDGICGFEILDQKYEIIKPEDIPENLT